MFLAQGGSHDPQALQAVVILAVILTVLFWRIAIRILAIVMALLVVSGVITLSEHLHKMIR